MFYCTSSVWWKIWTTNGVELHTGFFHRPFHLTLFTFDQSSCQDSQKSELTREEMISRSTQSTEKMHIYSTYHSRYDFDDSNRSTMGIFIEIVQDCAKETFRWSRGILHLLPLTIHHTKIGEKVSWHEMKWYSDLYE